MNIAVVGAGIAGLHVAQRVESRGHDVTVFEARDHIGGRLRTFESTTGWAEAGGEWLDADHTRCLELMREFGSAPERSTQWPGLVVCQGEFATENHVWPDAENDAAFVHSEAVELIRGGIDRDRPLGEWLDEKCMSPRGRWWAEAVARSDEGEDTRLVGLQGWLNGYAHYLDREPGDMSSYRFSVPAATICAQMAARLAQPVLTGTPVKQITESGEVVIEGQARRFDRVVCAVPPSQFRVLGLGDPPCRMARAIKIILEFTEPWWLEKSWTGRMICDLPCQQTWSGGRGGCHAISCYVCGDAAMALLNRPDPVDSALRALAEIHPEATESFTSGILVDWTQEPFIEGAFPSIPVGAFDNWQAAREPRGAIHFAGDWATGQIGFVEGALESADRVAEEIGS